MLASATMLNPPIFHPQAEDSSVVIIDEVTELGQQSAPRNIKDVSFGQKEVDEEGVQVEEVDESTQESKVSSTKKPRKRSTSKGKKSHEKTRDSNRYRGGQRQ